MGILLSAAAVCLVAIGYRLWASQRAGGRAQVYEQLAREQPFRVPSGKTVSVPEMAGATDHVQGQFGEFEVHVFENSSDFIEPGQEIDTRTIVLVSSPAWQLPQFHAEPRSFGTTLNERVGSRRPVLFPQDEAFMAACSVTGPDHGAIRRALTPKVLRLLGESQRISVESHGHSLLFSESETLLSLRQIRLVLEFALQVAGEFPNPQSGRPMPPVDR